MLTFAAERENTKYEIVVSTELTPYGAFRIFMLPIDRHPRKKIISPEGMHFGSTYVRKFPEWTTFCFA